ncbi:hypothetical protein [Symbiopectobacterium sp. RP]|uniref:hypothetical protein n=1 Tax=Symbiopectobacterium sp. RP TaxID=3248553 RepID=UPI003D28438B
MITANALVCGKKIQLIVIKIMSLGYNPQRQQQFSRQPLERHDAPQVLRCLGFCLGREAQGESNNAVSTRRRSSLIRWDNKVIFSTQS